MNPYKSPSKNKQNPQKSKSKNKSISPAKPISPVKDFLEESHISSLHLANTSSIKSLNASINTSVNAPIASSSQTSILSTQRQSANNLNKLKSMKRRAVYSAVNEFKNEAAVDDYIRENNSFPIFTTNNNPNNCTLCHNDDKHKMQVKYLKCSCKNDWCSLKYVIKRCIHSSTCYFSQAGTHLDPEKALIQDDSVGVSIKNKRPTRRYGLALTMVNLINEWLEEDDLITPRRLLSRIINKRKKELEKSVKERNDKYVYNKCLIPSIKQVN